MPKKITSVKWTASELPSGLSFDEGTGTFTGTAEEAGEYTVPITVRTNYGTDTKDLAVTVEGRAYPVYAVGRSAATWSVNAEADANGFRKLNMPDATKLLQHPSGFGAKTAIGKYYYCGVKEIKSTSGTLSSALSITTTPREMETISGYNVDEVKLLHLYRYAYNSLEYITSECYLLFKRYNRTKLSLSISGRRNTSVYKPTQYIWGSATVSGFDRTIDYKLPDGSLPTAEWNFGIHLLEGDGSTYTVINTPNTTNTAPSLSVTSGCSLGYKAIKTFGNSYTVSNNASHGIYPLYRYLSEDKLLNNKASNFTLGIIKDAWVYATRCYVYTEDGKLYEKIGTAGAWTDCGSYDVKKLIIYNEYHTFFLTQDGKIYHKGSAISNVTEAHGEFTQIFPDYYFHDMAFDVNTLTVTKED